MLAQQLVTVEVEVPYQGHGDAHLIQARANRSHRGGGFAAVDGDAHQLRPGACQRFDLLRRPLDVRGVGVRHRLDHDRGVAPDANGAY